MIDQDSLARLQKSSPILQITPLSFVTEFEQTAIFKRLPQKHDFFAQDQAVEHIALLLSGRMRVYQIGATGQEITLYRFGYGDTCMLTALTAATSTLILATEVRNERRGQYDSCR